MWAPPAGYATRTECMSTPHFSHVSSQITTITWHSCTNASRSGVVAGRMGGRNCPVGKLRGEYSSWRKIVVQNRKISGKKLKFRWHLRGKVEILSWHNLPGRKFAIVRRIIATSCSWHAYLCNPAMTPLVIQLHEMFKVLSRRVCSLHSCASSQHSLPLASEKALPELVQFSSKHRQGRRWCTYVHPPQPKKYANLCSKTTTF